MEIQGQTEQSKLKLKEFNWTEHEDQFDDSVGSKCPIKYLSLQSLRKHKCKIIPTKLMVKPCLNETKPTNSEMGDEKTEINIFIDNYNCMTEVVEDTSININKPIE